jgi:hypothetical protein
MGHLKRKLILTRKDQNDQLEKCSDETAQRQFGHKGVMSPKFKRHHSCQTSQKLNQGQEVVFMHVWLFGIKALLRQKLIFLARAFYFNRDKVTISTGSRHVLWYLEVVFLVLDLNSGFFLDS